MDLAMDIARVVSPLIIVAGFAVLVILRMKHKYEKGTQSKKNTKGPQNLLDNLIPFGMMIGFSVAVILSIFSTISLLTAMTWGPGIGFLFGYFAHEIYSKKHGSHS
ncbi:hypothetical protein [Bhargavaea beijingensis]|uniref:Uncharacterized protein n=1 Tax=Bhargavaea beijingensis TaxID=426756 RepID=A0ABX9ZFT8_9BACL|nr:hypothetical protein [Bhargavaea beijingensis]RSK36610.1 hypothetical protein EJA12_02360 [Bhargavaea beijingensis]